MSLIDSEDKKKDIVSFVILTAIILGFICFGYALYKKLETAYYPISGILITALGGTAIKATKKTS